MTIYTWLVVLLVAAAILFRGNRRHSKIFIVIAFILLFAVMGLRDVTAFGVDAWGAGGSYPNIYRNIGKTGWNELTGKYGGFYNIGFTYLMKLIYDLSGGDYQTFITAISFFVMFSYMRFIGKYSPSPIQSVLYFLGLLYFTFLFDALKQAIAMAFLLFAFDAIMEKKPWKFILFTVIAGMFHFPAFIFLPAYWIGHMKVGRRYIVLLAALLLVTFIFRNQLLNLMLNTYCGNEKTVSMSGIRFLRNKVIIMIAIAAFAALIRPPVSNDTLYNSLLMFLGVSIIFQTFCGYNNIFERLADYYFHTAIILFPIIFETGGKNRSLYALVKDERIISAVSLVLCILAIWRFLSYVNNSGSFLPYRFLWQQ